MVINKVKEGWKKANEKTLGRVRERVREMAIKNVKKDLVLHGRDVESLSLDDKEFMVAEAEKEIWSGFKGKSLLAVLGLLGLSFWG